MTKSADDLLRAFRATPRDARLGLFTGEALYREGYEEEAVAVWALAEEANSRLRWIRNAPNVPARARAASACADDAFRAHFTRLHSETIEAAARTTDADLSRVRNAVWPLTHDSPVKFRTALQRPAIFYMPDLPAEPVITNDRLPWSVALESAWQEIRDEYLQAVGEHIVMDPYVPATTHGSEWATLRGSLEWSSIHLYKDSQSTRHTARFPKIQQAVESVDLVRVDGIPMEVLFSRLRPGAHIPPHFGLTNTRLTVHLPLIVPDGCAIRIGPDIYHWCESEIVAFDDSFEHEAWNRSQTDRVVLILHAHHPDLSAAERAAIEQTYSTRKEWLQNRDRLLDRHLARG